MHSLFIILILQEFFLQILYNLLQLDYLYKFSLFVFGLIEIFCAEAMNGVDIG